MHLVLLICHSVADDGAHTPCIPTYSMLLLAQMLVLLLDNITLLPALMDKNVMLPRLQSIFL